MREFRVSGFPETAEFDREREERREAGLQMIFLTHIETFVYVYMYQCLSTLPKFQ